MKGLHIWLLVAIVIAGGAFMACKSSEKKTDSNQPTATRSSGATQTADTPSSSDGGNGGDASSQLSDLANKAATKTVKATYSFSSSAGGTTSDGTFTLYSKPPDSRVDFTTGGTTVIIISAGGKDYYCTPDGGGLCTESPSFGGAFPLLGFFTDPQQLSGLVGSDVNRSTKTIAGQDADCYSGSVQGASGEVCFNSDGVLVSLQGSAGGAEYTLEATSVEGSVSDADLEPPYPIEDIPGLN